VGVERVDPSAPPHPEARPLHLSIGERTSIRLDDPAHVPQAVPVTPAQAEAILAWQPRMLDFTATPLLGVVGEFNRHNAPIHLVVSDLALAHTEVSASLRSDNVEGFIRLLEAGFGVRAERDGDTITLRKAP
jgi:transmembrane sensor